jgi:hypothetical protein
MGRPATKRGPHFNHPVIVKIRERTAGLGSDQSKLARHLDTDPAKVNRWFQGHTFPPREVLVEVEDALQFARGELLVPAGYLPGDNAYIRWTEDGGIVLEFSAESIAPRARSENGRFVIAQPSFALATAS